MLHNHWGPHVQEPTLHNMRRCCNEKPAHDNSRKPTQSNKDLEQPKMWKSVSCVRLCNLNGLYSPWDSPGQNTGVGSLSLLQGIFPTQGSNPGLLHCRRILYQLSHKASPRILEWVASPFSKGSSQPRDRTRVSHTAGGFFTSWAIREAQILILEWVAYSFSSRSSQPRNRTRISCIAGGFFTNRANREAKNK